MVINYSSLASFLIFDVTTIHFAAIDGPLNRGPDTLNIPTNVNLDYTVYRTVITLSCHPQNALLGAQS